MSWKTLEMKDALCLSKELTSKLQFKINSLARLRHGLVLKSFQIGAVWNVFFACGGVLTQGEPVSKCLLSCPWSLVGSCTLALCVVKFPGSFSLTL